jgi:hypothetical protein
VLPGPPLGVVGLRRPRLRPRDIPGQGGEPGVRLGRAPGAVLDVRLVPVERLDLLGQLALAVRQPGQLVPPGPHGVAQRRHLGGEPVPPVDRAPPAQVAGLGEQRHVHAERRLRGRLPVDQRGPLVLEAGAGALGPARVVERGADRCGPAGARLVELVLGADHDDGVGLDAGLLDGLARLVDPLRVDDDDTAGQRRVGGERPGPAVVVVVLGQPAPPGGGRDAGRDHRVHHPHHVGRGRQQPVGAEPFEAAVQRRDLVPERAVGRLGRLDGGVQHLLQPVEDEPGVVGAGGDLLGPGMPDQRTGGRPVVVELGAGGVEQGRVAGLVAAGRAELGGHPAPLGLQGAAALAGPGELGGGAVPLALGPPGGVAGGLGRAEQSRGAGGGDRLVDLGDAGPQALGLLAGGPGLALGGRRRGRQLAGPPVGGRGLVPRPDRGGVEGLGLVPQAARVPGGGPVGLPAQRFEVALGLLLGPLQLGELAGQAPGVDDGTGVLPGGDLAGGVPLLGGGPLLGRDGAVVAELGLEPAQLGGDVRDPLGVGGRLVGPDGRLLGLAPPQPGQLVGLVGARSEAGPHAGRAPAGGGLPGLGPGPVGGGCPERAERRRGLLTEPALEVELLAPAELGGVLGEQLLEPVELVRVVDRLDHEPHEVVVAAQAREQALGVGLVGVHLPLVAEDLGVDRRRPQQVVGPLGGLVLDHHLELGVLAGESGQPVPEAGPGDPAVALPGRQVVEREHPRPGDERVPERLQVAAGRRPGAVPPLQHQARDQGTVGRLPLQRGVAGVAGADVAVQLDRADRVPAPGEHDREQQAQQHALATAVLEEEHGRARGRPVDPQVDGQRVEPGAGRTDAVEREAAEGEGHCGPSAGSAPSSGSASTSTSTSTSGSPAGARSGAGVAASARTSSYTSEAATSRTRMRRRGRLR